MWDFQLFQTLRDDSKGSTRYMLQLKMAGIWTNFDFKIIISPDAVWGYIGFGLHRAAASASDL